MTNFSDMAKKVKAAYEAKKADMDREFAAASEARSRIMDQGVELLQTQVIPHLQRAKDGFAAQGIDSKITSDFDKNFATKPSVSFRCLGPKRSDGYQFETIAAFFSTDGGTILIGTGENEHDREAKKSMAAHPGGDCAGLVSQAIEKTLTSYFEQVEKHERLGNL
jgi:hypothetical protein